MNRIRYCAFLFSAILVGSLYSEDLKVEFSREEREPVRWQKLSEILNRTAGEREAQAGPLDHWIPGGSADALSVKGDAGAVQPPERSFPPTRKPVYSYVLPETVRYHRNLMAPIPVQNVLQVYPFTMNLPTEGSEMLASKEMTFSLHHTWSDGKVSSSNSRYEIDMDQWFLEQALRYEIGLPWAMNFRVHVPLYHFSGNNRFLVDGLEYIGMSDHSRNFWSGPVFSLKAELTEILGADTKILTSFWLQLPEGNQRTRGGTSTGDSAFNLIIEKYYGSIRALINLGVIFAGDLKLLNDRVLAQKEAPFGALSLSYALNPELAIDFQAHAYRSALAYTDLPGFDYLNSYVSLGFRGNWRRWDLAGAMLTGLGANYPSIGLTTDFTFRW
ncbi:MAG: hypothetical protein HQL31_06290 [Planctomycetes bacterium]|nr:hypothetical protein [Planctomycetota bacterium]